MTVVDSVIWKTVGRSMALNLLGHVEEEHAELGKVFHERRVFAGEHFRTPTVKPSVEELAGALSTIPEEEMLAVVGLALMKRELKN